MRKIFVSMLFFLGFLSSPLLAAENPNPLADRQAAIPPALAFLQKEGVKLTFLGEEGGVKGYLGESSSGKMQTFYLTPDGNYVLAGLLFRSGGMNVTGIQISNMQSRYEEALRQMDSSKFVATEKKADAQPTPPVVASATPSSDAAFADSKMGSKDVLAPYRNVFDKAKFLADAQSQTAWFSVGSVGSAGAPELYFVADPQCTYCHTAWKKLMPLVTNNKIRINVVLVAALPGSESKAISILSRDRPGSAWLAGEGSSATTSIAPAPAPGSDGYKAGKKFLEYNMNFAEKYVKIGTPFFAYIGKDGNLYSAEGPKDIDGFLSGLPDSEK